MSAILEQIDPDITKASWIGAVHISVMCMSGEWYICPVCKTMNYLILKFHDNILFSTLSQAHNNSLLSLIYCELIKNP